MSNVPMPLILDLIRTNPKFRAELIQKDDNVVEDLYKFIETPSCTSCISKIENFVNKNIAFINNIVKEFTPSVEKVTLPEPPVTVVPAPVRLNAIKVAGEVYELPADPTQYKELIELSITERWIYRGFNLLEKVKPDGTTVWMIFFY